MALDKYPMDLLNMDLTQINGQRKYGGPPRGWTGPSPERGSEIFLKIPRDCFEDDLLPVLEVVGRVYEIRMMMDFSGSNRGYCFVTYANRAEARRAVDLLQHFPLKPGRKLLGARISLDNRKLFVGKIPCNKTKQDIFTELCRVTEEVKEVTVYKRIEDKSHNRSYAFVEYMSHKAAALARRALCFARLWGSSIIVDWAEPEPEVPEEKLAEVKCLFVRNFSWQTTQNSLMDEFCKAMGNSEGIKSVKIVRDFAFVDFYSREYALGAAAVMNGRIVDGYQLEVELAKPRKERFQSEAQQPYHPPPPPKFQEPKQTTTYCLDLLQEVHPTRRIREPSYEYYVRPDETYDVRSIVLQWKRKFPDLSFVEFLCDISVTEGWGPPDYFLKEIKQKIHHRKVKMFSYKVVIRGLGVHQRQFVFKPFNFVDDRRVAKEYAAIFALSRIRLTSLRGRPNRRQPEIQITHQDVRNFMAFMKTYMQPSPHAMSSVMACIDRELSQAYSLLSVSGVPQGLPTVPSHNPNMSAEMVPVAFVGSQDLNLPIFSRSDNVVVNQLPLNHFPGVPQDPSHAMNQLGTVNSSFSMGLSDEGDSVSFSSPYSAESMGASPNASMTDPNLLEQSSLS